MGTKQRAQIVMTADEVADFVATSRTGTLATIGPDGQPLKGIKDAARIFQFVAAVRAADAALAGSTPT